MVTLVEMFVALVLVTVNLNTIVLYLFRFDLEELERKINELERRC